MIGVLAVGVTTGVFVALAVSLLIAERYLANYGICNVRINEGAAEFELGGGGTLLSALYANKVFIPSACGGKGSCGYCKVTLLEGGGPLLPTEAPFMTRSEQRLGVRLACQVKIKENMELRLPEGLLNVREYRAKVSRIVDLTYDIREVTLDLVEPTEIHQKPGHYVQVMAPGPDGPVFRAYSIASPSHVTDRIQLVVRLVPEGIASTYIHGLSEGDDVVFTGPFGEFVLSEDPAVEIVCVGGGAGMAPMCNIIDTIYQRWPERKCSLYFGCRTTKDLFYLERFKNLAKDHPSFQVVYALSDPLSEGEDWDGDTGFVHLPLEKRFQPKGKSQAFLCGPPPMIEAVMEVLAGKSVSGDDVFYDQF